MIWNPAEKLSRSEMEALQLERLQQTVARVWENVPFYRRKMEELGVQNMSAYIRKMALDGYCIKLDLGCVKEMVTLLRRCSNNLNQYAKKANETGSIYEADIIDLQVRLDEIWGLGKEVLVHLSSIR